MNIYIQSIQDLAIDSNAVSLLPDNHSEGDQAPLGSSSLPRQLFLRGLGQTGVKSWFLPDWLPDSV